MSILETDRALRRNVSDSLHRAQANAMVVYQNTTIALR